MKRLMTALRKKARETGRNWQEEFVEHLYSPDWREAAAFFKMMTDKLFIKKSEVDMNVSKTQGPSIFLPEQRPDPVKLAPVRELKK